MEKDAIIRPDDPNGAQSCASSGEIAGADCAERCSGAQSVDDRDRTLSAMNPLVLAYIGDATYEKEVRKRMIAQHPNDKINQLHRRTVAFSKAASQSHVVNALKEAARLTEREWYFVKRGRNTQSAVPKNANVTDYRYATGFEAMVGYLELSGQQARIAEIVDFAVELIAGERC